jgi:hypothetical protein
VRGGVRGTECAAVLRAFFDARRRRGAGAVVPVDTPPTQE